MTASQLHTLPIPPMLTTNTGSTTSGILRLISLSGGNNLSSQFRAKRNLFGAPPPGEIKRICAEDNLKRCNEFKEKYNYDIQNERFTNQYNNNNNKNSNINNKNEDETNITTTTPTTTAQQTTIQQITELNNGQDEQSNIKNTKIDNINNNDDDNNKSIVIDVSSSSTIDKSVISKNLLIRKNYNLYNSECDVNENNDDDDNHIEVGISNNTKSLNDDDNKLNNSFNKCEVMCNQINSTTSSTITSTSVSVPTIKNNKKSIDIVVQQQQQRFTPYCKKQILITDLFKQRKASPVNIINRPQKAKLHFDETDQQQEQHLTSNEV